MGTGGESRSNKGVRGIEGWDLRKTKAPAFLPVISQEDGGSRGDDSEFMGLVAVSKTDVGVGDAIRLDMGSSGHNEVGTSGGEEWQVGLFGDMERRVEISAPELMMAVKGHPFRVMGMGEPTNTR